MRSTVSPSSWEKKKSWQFPPMCSSHFHRTQQRGVSRPREGEVTSQPWPRVVPTPGGEPDLRLPVDFVLSVRTRDAVGGGCSGVGVSEVPGWVCLKVFSPQSPALEPEGTTCHTQSVCLLGRVSAAADASLSLAQFPCPASRSRWRISAGGHCPHWRYRWNSLLHFCSLTRAWVEFHCARPRAQRWRMPHTSPGHMASGQQGLCMLAYSQASLSGLGTYQCKRTCQDLGGQGLGGINDSAQSRVTK